MREGVFRGDKVYVYGHVVHALWGGNWQEGWSGTKSSGGHKVYEVNNSKEFWLTENQEVSFELIDGKAIIEKTGKVLSKKEADCYCKIDGWIM